MPHILGTRVPPYRRCRLAADFGFRSYNLVARNHLSQAEVCPNSGFNIVEHDCQEPSRIIFSDPTI